MSSLFWHTVLVIIIRWLSFEVPRSPESTNILASSLTLVSNSAEMLLLHDIRQERSSATMTTLKAAIAGKPHIEMVEIPDAQSMEGPHLHRTRHRKRWFDDRWWNSSKRHAR